MKVVMVDLEKYRRLLSWSDRLLHPCHRSDDALKNFRPRIIAWLIALVAIFATISPLAHLLLNPAGIATRSTPFYSLVAILALILLRWSKFNAQYIGAQFLLATHSYYMLQIMNTKLGVGTPELLTFPLAICLASLMFEKKLAFGIHSLLIISHLVVWHSLASSPLWTLSASDYLQSALLIGVFSSALAFFMVLSFELLYRSTRRAQQLAHEQAIQVMKMSALAELAGGFSSRCHSSVKTLLKAWQQIEQGNFVSQSSDQDFSACLSSLEQAIEDLRSGSQSFILFSNSFLSHEEDQCRLGEAVSHLPNILHELVQQNQLSLTWQRHGQDIIVNAATNQLVLLLAMLIRSELQLGFRSIHLSWRMPSNRAELELLLRLSDRHDREVLSHAAVPQLIRLDLINELREAIGAEINPSFGDGWCEFRLYLSTDYWRHEAPKVAESCRLSGNQLQSVFLRKINR